MSDYDRGAYTPPTDDPLAFDARMTRSRKPMPLTLLASGVVLLVMVGALVMFYQSGVRGANEPPRVVGETVASLKTAPVEEAKPIQDEAGLEVYVDDPNGSTAAPVFAAAPEQPQARPAAAPVVETSTAPGEARSGVTVLRPTPAAEASAAPAAVAVRAPAPPPAKAAPAPVRVAEAPAPAAKGTASVQIGAFSSAAIANSEYAKVRSAFSQYTAGRGKHVEPVVREGQTLYRTTFTGFAREDAQKFCAALKAAGRACIVR